MEYKRCHFVMNVLTCYAKWHATLQGAKPTKFWQSFIIAGMKITELLAKK